MKMLKLLSLMSLLFLAACGTRVTEPVEVQSQAVAENVSVIKMKEVMLVNRNTKSGEVISAELLDGLQQAFESREITHAKLMPLFEYEMKFAKDGEEEIWRVNKAGYLMKNGSSELYKMDTTVLHDYMK